MHVCTYIHLYICTYVYILYIYMLRMHTIIGSEPAPEHEAQLRGRARSPQLLVGLGLDVLAVVALGCLQKFRPPKYPKSWPVDPGPSFWDLGHSVGYFAAPTLGPPKYPKSWPSFQITRPEGGLGYVLWRFRLSGLARSVMPSSGNNEQVSMTNRMQHGYCTCQRGLIQRPL